MGTGRTQETITVSRSLYPLDAVYAAANMFIHKGYILLDEDDNTDISVTLIPKSDDIDPQILAHEFRNELLRFDEYQKNKKKVREMREELIRRTFITNDPALVNKDTIFDEEEFEKLLKELEEQDDELDDPMDISVPWEEKYGSSHDEGDRSADDGGEKGSRSDA